VRERLGPESVITGQPFPPEGSALSHGRSATSV